MTEGRQIPPLADQAFQFSPDDADGDDVGFDPTEVEIVAATYRAIVDQDAFEEMILGWIAKLDLAPEHSRRPLVISRQLLRQLLMARRTMEKLDIPAENDPLKRAIADVPGPAVVLSPEGRIAIVNIAGEQAFGTRQGAFLDTAVIAPCSQADYAALRRAAAGRGNGAQAILTILPPEGARGSADPFLAEAYLINAPDQSAAFIAIRSLVIAWSAMATERLQQAFGLSQAEAGVAELYFRSGSIDRVAGMRGVSRLTVRTQIKAIMAKTGAPTNVDLMRLLAMVASRALLGHRGETPVWHDPLGRERRIELPDGRVVAWTWMGDEAGIPVVMLRGFPMTYLLPGEGEARLHAAGIRLCLLSRPGYGNSSLDPRVSALEDNLIALRAFLDREIAGPAVGVGLSQGLVPLLAEQHADPARFRALIAIGYTGVLDRSGIDRLAPIQRTMMRLAGPAPWVVELMAKTGHRQMRQHGVDWYLERAYRTRPLDMETYRHPDRAALIRNACEHLLKQGHGAFVRELQLALAPIDPVIETLEVPMQILAPTEDGVFDEASYRRIEARNPRITVEPICGTGELIFYQRTDLILDRIIAAAQGAIG
ncbi:MAG: alpha/beta hydrolase [Phyllobacteriaceae bacterium]|nr:alpha/beta hydrolase [Phyllobacteriaceae bacterium]